MVVVPVMLSRIVDVGEDEIKKRDTSALRIIFVSGSALGADLAQRAMNAFGPVVSVAAPPLSVAVPSTFAAVVP